jgi:hypothetical protein
VNFIFNLEVDVLAVGFEVQNDVFEVEVYAKTTVLLLVVVYLVVAFAELYAPVPRISTIKLDIPSQLKGVEKVIKLSPTTLVIEDAE